MLIVLGALLFLLFFVVFVRQSYAVADARLLRCMQHGEYFVVVHVVLF